MKIKFFYYVYFILFRIKQEGNRQSNYSVLFELNKQIRSVEDLSCLKNLVIESLKNKSNISGSDILEVDIVNVSVINKGVKIKLMKYDQLIRVNYYDKM